MFFVLFHLACLIKVSGVYQESVVSGCGCGVVTCDRRKTVLGAKLDDHLPSVGHFSSDLLCTLSHSEGCDARLFFQRICDHRTRIELYHQQAQKPRKMD